MKSLGCDHIDYWHNYHAGSRWLKSALGVRVEAGRCWALVQIGHDEAVRFGKAHEIPLDLRRLRGYLYFIVEEHQANEPTSDLLDVLAGRKSFQQALESRDKTEGGRSRNGTAFERV